MSTSPSSISSFHPSSPIPPTLAGAGAPTSSTASASKSTTTSTSKSRTKNSHNSPSQKPSFTARMKDRQARNKDPYLSSDESSNYDDDDDDDDDFFDEGAVGGGRRRRRRDRSGNGRSGRVGRGRGDDGYATDSYEIREKRREAAIILDSPELLMMHAQARCDSVPGTRLYFIKMLAGVLEESDLYPLPDTGGLKGKERERG